MKPPERIRDVARWQNTCRKILARALDLIEGRASVIETARELSRLALWTHLRDDKDLLTFIAIESDTRSLPIGSERKRWSMRALQREDVNLSIKENLYRDEALRAAKHLVSRFRWSADARRERRRNGGKPTDREVRVLEAEPLLRAHVKQVKTARVAGMKKMEKAQGVSAGVVHDLPHDLERLLVNDKAALERWEDLTPLARNEWICWVEDAKKSQTRQRRIDRLQEDLKNGIRRPCCWPGCRHRERNGR